MDKLNLLNLKEEMFMPATADATTVRNFNNLKSMIEVLRDTLTTRFNPNNNTTKYTTLPNQRAALIRHRDLLASANAPTTKRLLNKIISIFDNGTKDDDEGKLYIFLTPSDVKDLIDYCQEILMLKSPI